MTFLRIYKVCFSRAILAKGRVVRTFFITVTANNYLILGGKGVEQGKEYCRSMTPALFFRSSFQPKYDLPHALAYAQTMSTVAYVFFC
jgi:hypothetical protein